MTPRAFKLCFDDHHADGKVAAILTNGHWTCRARIECDVPIHSVYAGPTAKQPRFYFAGVGCVTIYADYIHIGYGR